jgi:hypothetical protein
MQIAAKNSSLWQVLPFIIVVLHRYYKAKPTIQIRSPVLADKERSLTEEIVDLYRKEVQRHHPNLIAAWPVISGKNTRVAQFGNWFIVIYEHTGNAVLTVNSSIGALPPQLLGVSDITDSNKDQVRETLERYFALKPSDGMVMFLPNGDISSELTKLLKRHEYAMGLTPMKIFLSHKCVDKGLVRNYKTALEILGFDPWLDEDAMAAGVELERGILKGFNESCAAVFFITEHFRDEKFLGSEVNYAIAEKRKKAERFSIITLVFNKDGEVPPLLQPYVWKEPKSDLEGFREIIKALPVKVGMVHWR